MPPIPADVLTQAQQQLASFMGITIGLLVAAIVLLISILFWIIKLSAEVQTVRRVLGITTISERNASMVSKEIERQKYWEDASKL